MCENIFLHATIESRFEAYDPRFQVVLKNQDMAEKAEPAYELVNKARYHADIFDGYNKKCWNSGLNR